MKSEGTKYLTAESDVTDSVLPKASPSIKVHDEEESDKDKPNIGFQKGQVKDDEIYLYGKYQP